MIDQPTVGFVAELAARITQSVSLAMSDSHAAVDAAIATLFAGGHLLIEDVPGVGKTTLATALGRSIDASVRRLQFTSDMLPSDVTGLSVYHQDAHEFTFHPGPIFSNVVIADEINRGTAKTQSALLEAMAERTVTIDGHTRDLPELFLVVATQNPGDMEGTFPLPEAQRDRFMTQISLGYPSADAETAMLRARAGGDPVRSITPVADVAEVLRAQRAVNDVHISEAAARYLVALITATRTHAALSLGASPRATLHLAHMARARALLRGRNFVTADDIARLASAVLTHRLLPSGYFDSELDATRAVANVVTEIVANTRAE
ncbi:hypothetical protein ACI1US_01859 [Leucobacter sp. BZR 635]